MKLKDFLEKYGDEEFDIVTDIDDFIDKLEEMMDEEPDEEQEEECECCKVAEEYLETARKKARKARVEIEKELGKEKADVSVDLAKVSAQIETCMDIGLPIPSEWVADYNRACLEVYPSICESPLLKYAYMSIEDTADKGKKSLYE